MPRDHLGPKARPALEEPSAAGTLGKELPIIQDILLLDNNSHPEIGRDLGGTALLGPNVLLLVSDDDFGVGGAKTGL